MPPLSAIPSTAVRAATSAASSLPTLKLGSSGPSVERLQHLLRDRGFDPHGADGQFGPRTELAVRAFQKAKGLPADGVVGPATWKALQGGKPKPPPRPPETRLQIFSTRAVAQNKRLDHLERDLKAFSADGKLAADERQKLKADQSRLLAQSNTMTAAQANPTLKALESLKLLNRQGLARHVTEAVAAIEQARTQTLAAAKSAASHDPLARLTKWNRPFPGVRTRDFTFEGATVHAVAVDLADPRVRTRTNSSANRNQDPTHMAQQAHAEVAVNGDFFSFGTHQPTGLAVTDGQSWGEGGGDKSTFEPFLAFNGQRAEIEKPYAHMPKWATNAVSSRPPVLRDGQVATTFGPKSYETDTRGRTGVGLSKDNRVMYLVAIPSGLDARGLGRLLKALGADDGIALDSGGSAQMYVKGRGTVQGSTDAGGSRPVANSILIQADRNRR